MKTRPYLPFATCFAATGVLFALASAPLVQAGTLTSMQALPGYGYSGPTEQSPPVKATDGSIYGIRGTTFYKLTSGGVYSTIASFTVGQVNSLLQGADGDLYGTTWNGGSNGEGTVFKLTLAGTTTVLGDFSSSTTGHSPGRLLQSSGGEFYGLTNGGGANGLGTVFKLDEAGSVWTLGTLVDFDSSTAEFPTSLIQGSDGSLYGTAEQGGHFDAGTLFSVDPATGYIQILVDFGGTPFSWDPVSPAYVFEKEPGKFIGVTSSGGYYGRGQVYTYTATEGCAAWMDLGEDYLDEEDIPDGGYRPNGLPVLGADGKLYGTMKDGGNYYSASQGCGTLYRITFDFSTYTYNYEDLVLFSPWTSVGALPQAGLAADGSGNFYGTTSTANTSSPYGGALFKFTP